MRAEGENMSYGLKLAADPDLQRLVRYKVRLLRTVREFLQGESAIEVPMPILQKTREGAPLDQWSTVDPFTGEGWFLRHSMEDHLHRLMPAFPRVFEIGKAIRAERKSATHATEFLLLELMFRDMPYEAGIDLICRLIRGPVAALADEEYGRGAQFAELRVRTWNEICRSTTGIDPAADGFVDHCVDWLREAGARNTTTYVEEWEVLEEMMKHAIEPACIGVTLVRGFPRALQHVCDIAPDDTAMRMSLVMNGLEFGDGGTKLTGGDEYRRIYAQNAQYRVRTLGLDRNDLPEHFLTELDVFPSSVFSAGIGIDRLTALVAGCSIAEAIQFVDG